MIVPLLDNFAFLQQVNIQQLTTGMYELANGIFKT